MSPPLSASVGAALFDYGGTLVEEVAFDTRAGMAWLLARATEPVSDADRQRIIERVDRVTREVASRRDELQIETPWTALTRLIYDACGVRFTEPVDDLELGFWNASVETRPRPGVRDALAELHRLGLPMGVVCNTSFRQATIRHELAKHGLADFLGPIVVSAEYAVRKPNPLLFDVAARLLGVACRDIWVVGDRLDTDVAGANAAGMTAIWYAPNAGQDMSQARLAVSSWAELMTMVRGTRRGELAPPQSSD